MTAQNQKRAPYLLGPNWQGVPLAGEREPQAPLFHASLRECARGLDGRTETETSKPAASKQRESEPQQLHLTLLKHATSWLSAKHAPDTDKKLQTVEIAKTAPCTWSASRPRSGVLGHIWSWLQAKYSSSSTKRLRVAEMVPLGEKRFLAVVSVEGREFLIGGGASGVSVVTQLDAARDTTHAPRGEFEFQGAVE